MFNGYIAERRKALTRQTQKTKRKQAYIIKKYHTEVQPVLLQRYQKRLRSFITKMEEKPIIINPENLQPIEEAESHFIFRGMQDWKSIYPSRQRQQKIKHDRVMSKMKTSPHEEQEQPRPRMHQFRIRDKNKQINAPMRYNSASLKASLEGKRAKTIETKKKVSKNKSRNQNKKEEKDSKKVTPGETNRGGGTLRQTSVSMSNSTSRLDYEETDFSKEKTQFAYKQKTDNIQIEAKLYEKLKEPDQKKLHFKKIADLALVSQDAKERRELKELLKKSGFSKVKQSVKIAQQKEGDDFSMLIEKMYTSKEK